MSSDKNSQQSKREPAPAPTAIMARLPTTHTSIHSVQSTRIIQDGSSSISIHSTPSVDVTSTDDDEEIMDIQTSIEQVAASQNSPQTTRTTRAGFNSISDTLGNLRSRLHQAHQERQRSSNSGTNTLIYSDYRTDCTWLMLLTLRVPP